MPTDAVDEVRDRLRAAADPATAASMRSYMRDRFDFFGVKTPERRSISAPLVKATRGAEIDVVIEVVDSLRSARERELHYVASDVLRANARRLPADAVDDVERWITTDAWWDTVDAIASPSVGEMVRSHPSVRELMDDWIEADDFWLARVAIIHQLRFGDDTDADRLFRYADRRAADTEFFIRKAIGWALRQYARTDADAVRTYVDRAQDRLSSLTIREATKHLG